MTGANDRYSRQERFAGIGEEGQRRIRDSAVAVAGLGALGSVAAEILARAGAGRLILIDRDFVEPSNLQRQFLYDESDAAGVIPKAIAAARRLAQVNSEISIEPAVADLTTENIAELLEPAAVIVDGTDNFETRYLLNDYSLSRGVPWIYAAAVGSYGLKLAVVPHQTACLRCVYPEPPQGAQPTCETAGVVGAVTATIGSLAAGDALKILARGPDSVAARLTTVDVWNGEIRQIAPPARDPACPACAGEFEYLRGARRAPVSLCGQNAVQIHERSRPVNLADLADRLKPIAPVRANEFALRATVDAFELTVFPDGRAIVKGTTDPGVARSVYAKYVGA